MKGQESLSEKPSAQCVVCATPEAYERLSADLPEKFAVLEWEAAEDGMEQFAALADRKVVAVNPPSSLPGMLEMCLLAQCRELKAIQCELPAKWPTTALNWAAMNATLWPEKLSTDHQESGAQQPGSVRTGTAPSSVPPVDALDPKSAPPAVAETPPTVIAASAQRAAADLSNPLDPSQDADSDLQDADPAQDIGEPPQWVLEAPDGPETGPNGHDNAEPSWLWIKPLGGADEWGDPTDVFDSLKAPKPMQTSMLSAWQHDFAQDRATRIGGARGAIVQPMLVLYGLGFHSCLRVAAMWPMALTSILCKSPFMLSPMRR